MLNDRSTPLALLKTRRSGRPRDLAAPGPDAEQLREIVAIALRTPDHGKLAPWRFVHVEPDQRDALASLLHRALRRSNPHRSPAELEAAERFARQAPCLLVALSSPVPSAKIPVWEQELSCGASLMNLLAGAHAMGFAAGWITGWAAYDPEVVAAFCRPGERIAGFMFIGTPVHPLEERPRPAVDDKLSRWEPPSGA
jgi:nitroreductase